jgi:XTP/dITP diphosphohydrolase
MVLSLNGRKLKTVRGQVRGRIAAEPKGDLGFGYDPVFFYRPWGRTFGEISPARKNTVSHRGRALARMKAFLAGRR